MNPKQFIVFLNSIGAMLVEAANRVFTKSQRKTLTYADPKQAGALGDHPLGDKSGTFTLSQIFSVYSNGGEAGNPITLSVPFVFPSGDGMYRVFFPEINGYNTEIGQLTNGCYANISVVNGLPVTANSWVEGLSVAEVNAIQSNIASASNQNLADANANTVAKIHISEIQMAGNLNVARTEITATAAATAQTKADTAKSDAIAAAAATAQAKADAAQTAAIAAAQTKADAAQTAAIAAAQTKADAAELEANIYTDSKLAALQAMAKEGYESRFYTGVVETNAAGELICNTFPTLVEAEMTKKGYYLLEVTGIDTDGEPVLKDEFKLEVVTGQNPDGTFISQFINVSTEDKLVLETVSDLNGGFYSKFIKKYENYLRETVVKMNQKMVQLQTTLETEIETQVSETELETALDDLKTWMLANFNPALVA